MKHPDPDAGVSRETGLSTGWTAGARDLTGAPLDAEAVDRLERYLAFLRTEGIASGGLGPAEESRLLDRHMADSLAFARFLPSGPFTAIDVGSGLGLPGIPLSVTFPDSSWVLVDRSGRRCALMRRAVRMLDLDRVEVWEDDVSRLDGAFDVVTFRASLRFPEAGHVFRQLAGIQTVGVYAVSRQPKQPTIDAAAMPDGVTVDLEAVEHPILDSPAWFLRMRST